MKTDFKTFKATYRNQTFTIVSAFLNMRAYAEKAITTPDKINRFYNDLIFQPIYGGFVAGGEYAELMNTLKQPISNTSALLEEIALLENADISQFVFNQTKTVSDSLSGPNTNFILLAMNPDAKDMFNQYGLGFFYTGITAVTTGAGNIIISIDPREANWRHMLKYVIAHEYHHSVWTSRNFTRFDFSLLEYLIFEGRADYFASKIFPDVKVPWTQNLTPEKEKEVWNIIKDKLKSRDEDLNTKIMVGDEKIPFGSGYSIGYNIVTNYMENYPDCRILELTDRTHQEILINSKYMSYIDRIE